MAHDLDGVLLGIGNPLLDIAAVVDDEFLNKYVCCLASEHTPRMCTLPGYCRAGRAKPTVFCVCLPFIQA